MRLKNLTAFVVVVVLGLAGCSRDPKVVKVRYFDSGNKYFDKGRYKEASIQYRNALKRDQRYGPAHYKLALTDLRIQDYSGAVGSFRRALETLPKESPDRLDSMIKLSELYLAGGKGDKGLMADVDQFIREMLAKDPNSFDGHRLLGDFCYTKASEEYQNKRNDEARASLLTAIAEYRKADSIKPGQQGVTMQLARALAGISDFAGSEQLYRSVMAKDKSFEHAYTELYRLFLYQSQVAIAQKDLEGAKAKRAAGEEILKTGYQNNPKQYGFLTLLALQYYGEQRREDMIGVLNQIKSKAKEYDAAYLNVGDFYLRMGDADSAIREYKEGIQKDPKKKSIYQKHWIEVLMRQGKREEAAVVNKAILDADPSDNDARGLSATFMLDRGDVTKALGELQAVVTGAPANPVARYNLGRAFLARNEWEQARQQFLKAIDLNSNYVLARLALAQLQVSRGENDAALKTAQAILAIDPGNGNARLLESAALMGQKKFTEARTLLDAMVKSAPSSTDAHFQLGMVNLAEGKYKEAEAAFSRSYQLNPANSRGLMGIVETHMAQDKTDAALALLQAESDKAPTRLDLLLALGNTAVRAGKYDLALATYNKLQAQLPKGGKEQADVYLRIGETYRRKGDLNSAVQALQNARQSLPGNTIILGTLAVTLDSAGRRPEARQVYEAALKIQPDNPVALNNLAFLMAETGTDLDDALTKAQRAKQLLPSLYEVSDTLGWIYLKKNLSDSAIDVFKDLVVKQPANSIYRYHLAMAYNMKGDRTKALEQLKEALKYNPNSADRKNIDDLIIRIR